MLPDTLTVTSATPPPNQANLTVLTSGTVTMTEAGTTTYSAGQQVALLPGFTTLMKAYKGDTVKDSTQMPDWVYWAWEYDAELYASMHNQ